MFKNPTKSDQNNSTALIQQCLANYDYSNATLLAEDLLLNQDSEENKGLLADCYLAQQENHKAYFLLKNSKSLLNTYKFAVACVRLNRLPEAEKALTRECLFDGDNVPNGAYGLQLLASIYKKQNKTQQAKRYYEKALESNPLLLSTQKKLEKLGQGFNHDEGVKEAPKSHFNNPFGAGGASNHPLFSGGNVETEIRQESPWNWGVKKEDQSPEEKNYEIVGLPSDEFKADKPGNSGSPWNWGVKKEDQSPEEKSYEIVGSPSDEFKAEKPVFVMDDEFDEQGYEVYVNEGRVFSKKFSFPEFMGSEIAWIQILKQKNAGEIGDYIFWYRSKRTRQESQIEKEHSRDLQSLIEKFDEKVAKAKQRTNCIDLNADVDMNKANEKKYELCQENLSNEEKKVKKVPAVDRYFDEEDCGVYSSEGKFYSKILNQTNITRNNNKFYIMQVLRSKKEKDLYFVFFRWGRVGVQGQSMKKIFKNSQDAVKEFEKKLHDKTVKGDYRELEIYFDDNDLEN